MFRLLGVLLIIGGMTGLGQLYVQNIRFRIEELERWEYIFQLFQSQITYKKQPLPLACKEIGRKIRTKEGDILVSIGENIGNGQGGGFQKEWEKNWKLYLQDSYLSQEEKNGVLEFGTFTGFEEEMLQNNMLKQQQEKMKKFRFQVEEENREKKRVVMLLSSCAGILLVLVLL